MKQSFYGGVHPNDRKELARHKEVAPLSAAPKQVVIAMAMHVGAPCKPIVAVGDQVKVGQKIGEIAGLGAHSRVCVRCGQGGGAPSLRGRRKGDVGGHRE